MVAYAQADVDFTRPMLPTNSKLTLSGGQLRNVGGGSVWLRPSFADDKPDEDISFTADIFPSDFYVNTGDDYLDALRASATVFIAVWTTSGAFHLQRLILWPMTSIQPASTILANRSADCVLDEPRTFLSTDESGGCIDGGEACNANFTRWTRATVQATYGGSSYERFGTDEVRVTRFASIASPGWTLLQSLADIAVNGVLFDIPPPCTAEQQEFRSGSGRCGGLPPRATLPRTATYRRAYDLGAGP